jgi:RNA polymerase sigma-K factor
MLLQSSTYYIIGDKMLQKILRILFKNFTIFTASYSNNVFPDPLSKEEEEYYIQKHLEGDTDARNKLIEHNLRLVAHIVKKYDSKVEDSDDLISIGTIGLIKGVDSFSSKHGTKITTYCARCIENEILMYFRANNKNLKNVSLNESIGFDKDGNEITILDILKSPKPDFIDEINKKDNIKLLKNYLKILTPREQEIVIRRYGLNNTKEQTQKTIAKELKISRSYVSRIEKRALTKILREFMKNKSTN